MQRNHRQLSLSEVHEILFSILEAVIDLCETEKIEYFLIGGACLGIVRHDNQLIPWDDDIDISIWAGDMPRFIEAAKNLPMPYQAVIHDKIQNSVVKVMDSSTRIISDGSNRHQLRSMDGVFIDIVPMMHWRYQFLKKINDLYAYALSIQNTTYSTKKWKKNIKNIVRYSGLASIVIFFGHYFFQPLALKMDSMYRKHRVGYISGSLGRRWIALCPTQTIYPLNKVRLGRLLVSVPNNLDEYLSIRYGKFYMDTPRPSILWTHFEQAVKILK